MGTPRPQRPDLNNANGKFLCAPDAESARPNLSQVLASSEFKQAHPILTSARTFTNWAARTPENLIFPFNVPHVVTHEKMLVDCDDENLLPLWKQMDILGQKLGGGISVPGLR